MGLSDSPVQETEHTDGQQVSFPAGCQGKGVSVLLGGHYAALSMPGEAPFGPYLVASIAHRAPPIFVGRAKRGTSLRLYILKEQARENRCPESLVTGFENA